MKLALPENAKIAKEAKECMQECVSEFISFITSEGECSCIWLPVPVHLTNIFLCLVFYSL
jgi:hypothetical protein